MTWEELESIEIPMPDRVNGHTNAQARLRLFGRPESEVRVTLYRDHHAWCPYCQEVHRAQQLRRTWAKPPCGTCL